MEQQLIKQELDQLAGVVEPLNLEVEHLSKRVIARRRRRKAGAVLGALVLVGGASAGYGHLASARNSADVAAGRNQAGGAVWPDQMQRRDLSCGKSIDQPIVGADHGPFSLVITKVSRGSDDTVQVSAAITSKTAVRIPDRPGPTDPRLLITRNGVVVAGQDPKLVMSPRPLTTVSPGHGDLVLRTVHVDPAHPYLISPWLASPNPCAGLTWAQLWASDAGLQAVVVVSANELIGSRQMPPDTDPLFLAQAPLLQ
jgi:hypothetical protein